MSALSSHYATLPTLGNLFEFPTVEALQAAYAQHLLSSGKETIASDARWVAAYETRYNPLVTVRGSFIEDFGFSTERDPILANCEAHRRARYESQGLPVPEFKGYLGGLYGTH